MAGMPDTVVGKEPPSPAKHPERGAACLQHCPGTGQVGVQTSSWHIRQPRAGAACSCAPLNPATLSLYRHRVNLSRRCSPFCYGGGTSTPQNFCFRGQKSREMWCPCSQVLLPLGSAWFQTRDALMIPREKGAHSRSSSHRALPVPRLEQRSHGIPLAAACQAQPGHHWHCWGARARGVQGPRCAPGGRLGLLRQRAQRKPVWMEASGVHKGVCFLY